MLEMRLRGSAAFGAANLGMAVFGSSLAVSMRRLRAPLFGVLVEQTVRLPLLLDQQEIALANRARFILDAEIHFEQIEGRPGDQFHSSRGSIAGGGRELLSARASKRPAETQAHDGIAGVAWRHPEAC